MFIGTDRVIYRPRQPKVISFFSLLHSNDARDKVWKTYESDVPSLVSNKTQFE